MRSEILAIIIILIIALSGCSQKAGETKAKETTSPNSLETPEIQELDEISNDMEELNNIDMGVESIKEATDSMNLDAKANVTIKKYDTSSIR